jgi:hypothetical protein
MIAHLAFGQFLENNSRKSDRHGARHKGPTLIIRRGSPIWPPANFWKKIPENRAGKLRGKDLA